jgi:PPK2 family polyphosphate:nucleotide phosphotransferase
VTDKPLRIDLDRYRVKPGQPADLAGRATDDTAGLDKHADDNRIDDAKNRHRDAIRDLQERLYAEGKQSLLVVLQAMDGGGKDSTIEKVFGPINPQGVRVWSFKKPTPTELAHDFLWRVHKRTPGDGYIGVFNRSHYEDVLIVKVHGMAPPDVIERRYDQINAFEALLADARTRVIKLYIHVSKDYQLERMRRRLRKPDKHWKFNPADLEERQHWDRYMAVYEEALTRCSTDAAPWYVVPGEQRWFRNLLVNQLLHEALADMDPQFPEPTFDPADYPPESLQ